MNAFYPEGMNTPLGYDRPQSWGGNFLECSPPAMTFYPTVLMACQANARMLRAMILNAAMSTSGRSLLVLALPDTGN